MKRATASAVLCALALVLGVHVAAKSSANRARGNELDRLQRWCEAQSRQNELLRVALEEREGLLLASSGEQEGRIAP